MSGIETYLKALSATGNALEIVTDKKACEDCIGENHSRVPASKPQAILYPVRTEQVQKLVQLANESHVSLVVRSSRGNETLNGSSLPAEGSDSVAVNLSKMNKIMRIDPKNNMAIVEAGVTYGQLNDALEPHGLYCEHPLAPRAEKSVIAALLDRTPVMTPKHLWDVPDPLCCVEMVMGNGALFRSGSAAGPGTLEEMFESGCGINQAQGPVWLDLGRVITGSQGTLAIVTWASIKVRPIGTVHKPAFVQSDDIKGVTAFASMMIRQRLGEEVLLLNRKGLAQVTDVKDEVTRGMPKWTLVSDVRGFRFFPERHMNNQFADMEDIAKKYGLSIQKELKGIPVENVYDALRNPSKKGAYWKQRYGKKLFNLFCLNTMDKIGPYTVLAEAAVTKCGLNGENLCVYAQPSQMGRNCHIEFIINADGETADKLEKMLGSALLDNMAFFSRPYGKITESVYGRHSGQAALMPSIKLFFDENRIMGPGKLVCDGGGNKHGVDGL
jgi:FAD/FMN-containing dehydrogenase